MKEQCTEDRFLSDIKEHKINIIRDDGVNRHLRFRKPETFCYWFDIITWDGYLCIAGDMGTFVFSRIPDMFSFFRGGGKINKYSKNKKLNINTSYWGEKLTSISRFGGYKEFSPDLFREAVKYHFDNYFEFENDEDKNEVWREIDREVLSSSYDGMTRAYDAVSGFKSFRGHEFQDFWEYSFEEYTFHYIWCLYAIVWGINKYDKEAE